MVGQYWDIFRNIAERWSLNVNHLQAVIHIFAKCPLFDGSFQGLIRCRDNAHIDRYRDSAADSVHRTFLENSEDFGLSRQAQIADLIQKQRSPVGFLEFSDAAIDAGGDSLFDAEQLRFHEVVRQRRTIQGYERVLRPRATVVQGFRDQFFSGAALAFDQDVHRAIANLVDQTNDGSHPVAHADDVLGGKPASVVLVEVSFLLQRAVLQLLIKLGGLDGVGDVGSQGLKNLCVLVREQTLCFVNGFADSDDLSL